MSSFSAIFTATLPIFMIMGVGAAFRAAKLWPEAADQPLARLAINVFYPSLIAHHVLGNPVLQNVRVLAWAAGSGFVLLLISFAAGLGLARALGLKSGRGFRTFAVCGGIQNYGFLPIPIIHALFPADEATRLLGILFLFNLGVEVAIWTVGVSLLRGSDRGTWRHLINTPLVTILLASSLTLLGGAQHIPSPLTTVIAMLGQAAIPISLFLVGASLWTANQETQWLGSWRVPVGAALLRFALLPGVFFAAACYLPISPELQHMLIIQGTMPSGAFVIVLARHYGGHPPTASQIVISTSLLSLLAVPGLLAFGLRLIAS